MDERSAIDQFLEGRVAGRLPQLACQWLPITTLHYRAPRPVVKDPQRPGSGSAKCMRLFQYGVEDRLKVSWRGIDHLQYLGGRGLLLQCLARLGQQPGVLDRDHRLRGEILQQRDLLLGERSGLASGYGNYAEQRIVFA